MKKMFSTVRSMYPYQRTKDFRKCLQVRSVSLVYFSFKCFSVSSPSQ